MKIANQKDFTGIDVFKFFFSLAVIAIHVSVHSFTGGYLPDLIHWCLFLCVPYFFIVSGFLVARKVDSMSDGLTVSAYFRRRSFQLFRIYGCWLLIYLPITIYLTLRNHGDIWKSMKGYVFSVLFDGHSEYAWPLWFIYSMAIVFLIFSLCKNKDQPVIIILFFVAATFIEWWHNISSFNGIEYLYRLTYHTLGGGIYIVAGMVIYRTPKLRGFVPMSVFFALSILLFLLMLPFWELLGGIAFVNLAIMMQLPKNKIYLKLRTLSMWIYYLHMYPIFFIALACKLNDVTIGFDTMFGIVSFSTIVLGICLSELSTRVPQAHWLSYLIK